MKHIHISYKRLAFPLAFGLVVLLLALWVHSNSNMAADVTWEELRANQQAWNVNNQQQIKNRQESLLPGAQENPGIPTGIQLAQLGPVFSIADKQYRLVFTHTMNEPLLGFGEALSYEEANSLWHGVLVSVNGGKTWEKFYEVKNVLEKDGLISRINPVGIFEKQSQLFLDIADDHGAGSGEGNMIRLVSEDEGKTWKQTGCYYFITDKYYPKLPDRTVLATTALKTSKSCVSYTP